MKQTILLFYSITVLVFPGFQLFAQGLDVLPGTCLEVVTGTTLYIANGNLTIQSDASGDASLLDNGSVAFSGDGEAKVERFMSQQKWHYISSPVIGAQAGMFEGAYLMYFTETSSSFTDITTVGYNLEPMVGYTIWLEADEAVTETFEGVPNTGTQQFLITAEDLRWNLVGNPYPSQIDWDMVTIPPNLNAYFYVYMPEVDDYGYYIPGGGELNSTSQQIASGQSFFVRAVESAASGNFEFANNVRTHGTQQFYKQESQNSEVLLKVTGNNATTKTGIRFLDEATPMHDRLFDVERLFTANLEIPCIYSYANGVQMAINSLPNIAQHPTIDLGFTAGINGQYKINASQLNTIPDNYPVILEDVELFKIIDLRSTPEYVFNYSEGEERPFKLHFKDVTSIAEIVDNGFDMNCFLENNKLHVDFTDTDQGALPATIQVYNLAGQLIFHSETRKKENEFNFQGAAAFYIVTVSCNQSFMSTKVINQ